MSAGVSAGLPPFSSAEWLSRRAVLRLGAGGGLATSLAATRPAGADTPASAARLRLARLALPDLPDPRPSALNKLAWELERRTSLAVAPDPVSVKPADSELFSYPMLLLSGDRQFSPLPEAAVVRLRRFLTHGGFLLIDSAEGRAGGAFDQSVRALLARLLPGDLPRRLPDNHVIYRSFYRLQQPQGRILAAPYLEACERDKRLLVLYSQNDVCGALARDGFGRWEHEVIPDGDSQRELVFRLAVNVVMYALCLDYKDEQAHIDFILRTRRSRF